MDEKLEPIEVIEVTPEYLRMYYGHQYDRVSKLEDQQFAITNVVATLSTAAFAFGCVGVMCSRSLQTRPSHWSLTQARNSQTGKTKDPDNPTCPVDHRVCYHTIRFVLLMLGEVTNRKLKLLTAATALN